MLLGNSSLSRSPWGAARTQFATSPLAFLLSGGGGVRAPAWAGRVKRPSATPEWLPSRSSLGRQLPSPRFPPTPAPRDSGGRWEWQGPQTSALCRGSRPPRRTSGSLEPIPQDWSTRPHHHLVRHSRASERRQPLPQDPSSPKAILETGVILHQARPWPSFCPPPGQPAEASLPACTDEETGAQGSERLTPSLSRCRLLTQADLSLILCPDLECFVWGAQHDLGLLENLESDLHCGPCVTRPSIQQVFVEHVPWAGFLLSGVDKARRPRRSWCPRSRDRRSAGGSP